MVPLYPLGMDGIRQPICRRFGGPRRGQSRQVPTELTPYPNGPYLLRGDFRLTDPNGDEIDPRRKTIALCRCGASRRKPFCDGTHKLIGFRASGGETVPVAQAVPGREAAP
jgi:CDGSH-type Zn-finger protein